MIIYVCIYGGAVMGFHSDDIYCFEESYKSVSDCCLYWDYFNHYFKSELKGRKAFAYSSLWNNTTDAEPETLRVS